MNKKLIFISILFLTFFSSAAFADHELAALSNAHSSNSTQEYQAKDFSYLIGMPGFSDEALTMHFKLYQGYVKNTNLLLGILKQYVQEGKERTPQFAEIKRRVMWEFDGMRLHEDYFSNLGGGGEQLNSSTPLYDAIVKNFGSFEVWKTDFIATGAMRGIGWAILAYDPVSNRLFNLWINEHDRGHLAGGNPLLIMDVFEHAYLLDYGLDRGKYIDAFLENIDWDVVKNRYNQATKNS